MSDVRSTDAVQKRERAPTKGESWMSVVGVAGNLGYMIALPAVFFVVGGAFLDKWLGTSPLFVLIGIPLALAVSAISVWRLIQQVNRENSKKSKQEI